MGHLPGLGPDGGVRRGGSDLRVLDLMGKTGMQLLPEARTLSSAVGDDCFGSPVIATGPCSISK